MGFICYMIVLSAIGSATLLCSIQVGVGRIWGKPASDRMEWFVLPYTLVSFAIMYLTTVVYVVVTIVRCGESQC